MRVEHKRYNFKFCPNECQTEDILRTKHWLLDELGLFWVFNRQAKRLLLGFRYIVHTTVM